MTRYNFVNKAYLLYFFLTDLKGYTLSDGPQPDQSCESFTEVSYSYPCQNTFNSPTCVELLKNIEKKRAVLGHCLRGV